MQNEPTQVEDALDVEFLQRAIAEMVASYQRTRSAMIAWFVVRYASALSRHPEFPGTEEERCAYCRLSRHWRWRAQSGRESGNA
jgi:hypothetical protein